MTSGRIRSAAKHFSGGNMFYPSVEGYQVGSGKQSQLWQGTEGFLNPVDALAVAQNQVRRITKETAGTFKHVHACILVSWPPDGWDVEDVRQDGTLFRLTPRP